MQERLREIRDAILSRAAREPLIMGILNVTPDSFSDGGQTHDPQAALMRALEMTLSSSQNIGEGLDRLTRAGATTATADLVENTAGMVASVPQDAAGVLPLTSSLQLAARISAAPASAARWL